MSWECGNCDGEDVPYKIWPRSSLTWLMILIYSALHGGRRCR